MVSNLSTVLVLLAAFSGIHGAQRKVSRTAPPPTEVKRELVNFDCPEEFGYYPHPSDCTQYYVCVFGGALLESCTGGLMYSHELQTCDWPRNVGCDGLEISGSPAQSLSSTSSSSSSSRSRERDRQRERENIEVEDSRNRYSVPPPPPPPQPKALVTSRGQSRQLSQTPQEIVKQQLYADAEEVLPPAEEVENDRPQRVYRGQPSTIGQVQRDRDAYRHTNAITQYNKDRGEKIGVISFGTQQHQHYKNRLTDINEITTNDLTPRKRLKRQVVYRSNLNGGAKSWHGDQFISKKQQALVRGEQYEPSQTNFVPVAVQSQEQEEFRPYVPDYHKDFVYSQPATYQYFNSPLPVQATNIKNKNVHHPNHGNHHASISFGTAAAQATNIKNKNIHHPNHGNHHASISFGTTAAPSLKKYVNPSFQQSSNYNYNKPKYSLVPAYTNVEQKVVEPGHRNNHNITDAIATAYSKEEPSVDQSDHQEETEVDREELIRQTENAQNEALGINGTKPENQTITYEYYGKDDDHDGEEYGPPPSYFETKNKYENIPNPFADPYFDFDSFLSRLSGTTTTTTTTTTTLKPPKIIQKLEEVSYTTNNDKIAALNSNLNLQSQSDVDQTNANNRITDRPVAVTDGSSEIKNEKKPVNQANPQKVVPVKQAQPESEYYYEYEDEVEPKKIYSSQVKAAPSQTNKAVQKKPTTPTKPATEYEYYYEEYEYPETSKNQTLKNLKTNTYAYNQLLKNKPRNDTELKYSAKYQEIPAQAKQKHLPTTEIKSQVKPEIVYKQKSIPTVFTQAKYQHGVAGPNQKFAPASPVLTQPKFQEVSTGTKAIYKPTGISQIKYQEPIIQNKQKYPQQSVYQEGPATIKQKYIPSTTVLTHSKYQEIPVLSKQKYASTSAVPIQSKYQDIPAINKPKYTPTSAVLSQSKYQEHPVTSKQKYAPASAVLTQSKYHESPVISKQKYVPTSAVTQSKYQDGPAFGKQKYAPTSAVVTQSKFSENPTINKQKYFPLVAGVPRQEPNLGETKEIKNSAVRTQVKYQDNSKPNYTPNTAILVSTNFQDIPEKTNHKFISTTTALPRYVPSLQEIKYREEVARNKQKYLSQSSLQTPSKFQVNSATTKAPERYIVATTSVPHQVLNSPRYQEQSTAGTKQKDTTTSTATLLTPSKFQETRPLSTTTVLPRHRSRFQDTLTGSKIRNSILTSASTVPKSGPVPAASRYQQNSSTNQKHSTPTTHPRQVSNFNDSKPKEKPSATIQRFTTSPSLVFTQTENDFSFTKTQLNVRPSTTTQNTVVVPKKRPTSRRVTTTTTVPTRTRQTPSSVTRSQNIVLDSVIEQSRVPTSEEISSAPTQPSTSSATARTTYNNTQYNNNHYDPYYSLYDDDAELYRDVDYSQHTNYNNANSGNTRGSSTYRGNAAVQTAQAAAATPVREETPKRGNSVYNNYNNQDIYQQSTVTDYNDNTYQDEDNSYRQSSRQPTRGDRNEINDVEDAPTKRTTTTTRKPFTTAYRSTAQTRIIPPKKNTIPLRSPGTANENQTQAQSNKTIPEDPGHTFDVPISQSTVLNPSEVSSELYVPTTALPLTNEQQDSLNDTPDSILHDKPRLVPIKKPTPFALSSHLTDKPAFHFITKAPKSTHHVSSTTNNNEYTLSKTVLTSLNNSYVKKKAFTTPSSKVVIIPTTYSPPKYFLKSILPGTVPQSSVYRFRPVVKSESRVDENQHKPVKTLKFVRKLVNPITVNHELSTTSGRTYESAEKFVDDLSDKVSFEENPESKLNVYSFDDEEIEEDSLDSSTVTIFSSKPDIPDVITSDPDISTSSINPVAQEFVTTLKSFFDKDYINKKLHKLRYFVEPNRSNNYTSQDDKKPFRTTVEIPPAQEIIDIVENKQKPEPDQPPSYRVKPSLKPQTLQIVTTTNNPQNTSFPTRVSRVNNAIKSLIAIGNTRGQNSKCSDNKCKNDTKPRTSARGRGTTHYSSGSVGSAIANNEVTVNINRGTPAPRSRPTLKPSTSIVSKATEFVDIYRYPPTRPEPIYPQPQPDKTAAKCRKDVCLLPDCNCGGKDIPGDLQPEQVPQIVLLTFDDSVNDLNKGLYQDLFEKGRTNPNGCPISATFYVSHEWTDYSQVQNLYSDGHELASHTVSHSFGEQFSQKKWTREVAGQREILSAYGGVHLEDVRGMRAPFLSVGGNKMFKMLYDSNFTYDSSMPIYENKPPSWPYTLDYKLFHDCMIPPCPTRSYPGVWEVPMVMWQDLNGGRCSMGDACSNPSDADGVYKMIMKNFQRHYTTNRAPFGLFYHAAWFTQPHHKEGFINFIDTVLAMKDVWFLTNWQAIQWVRDPTPTSRLGSFQPFQCNYSDRPKRCNNPKVCNLWHKSGVRYMRTCQPCPDIYPWTGNTGIRSSKIDNDIED